MIFGFTSKLIRTITLNRVIIWSLSALLAVTLYTIYENRGQLVNYIASPKPDVRVAMFEISEETRERVQGIADADPSVIAIGISSADLRRNEIVVLDWYGKTPATQMVGQTLSGTELNSLPIFTSSDENNIQILKLINGEFSCTPFADTTISRIYPELASEITTVCGASIPAYYGYFSGTISVFFNKQLSPEKEQQMKLITDKISNEIYFRDVLQSRRHN